MSRTGGDAASPPKLSKWAEETRRSETFGFQDSVCRAEQVMRAIEALVPVEALSPRSLSLESRIALLRRRRRVSLLRQLVVVVGPLLLGASILLLIATGGVLASGS
jgi:hypothetical protein